MKPTKERSRHGRTQTAMAVRIDNDLLPYLNAQPNKAMAINKAIRVQAEEWQRRQKGLFENLEEPSCANCFHGKSNTHGSAAWCTLHLKAYRTPPRICPDWQYNA